MMSRKRWVHITIHLKVFGGFMKPSGNTFAKSCKEDTFEFQPLCVDRKPVCRENDREMKKMKENEAEGKERIFVD